MISGQKLQLVKTIFYSHEFCFISTKHSILSAQKKIKNAAMDFLEQSFEDFEGPSVYDTDTEEEGWNEAPPVYDIYSDEEEESSQERHIEQWNEEIISDLEKKNESGDRDGVVAKRVESDPEIQWRSVRAESSDGEREECRDMRDSKPPPEPPDEGVEQRARDEGVQFLSKSVKGCGESGNEKEIRVGWNLREVDRVINSMGQAQTLFNASAQLTKRRVSSTSTQDGDGRKKVNVRYQSWPSSPFSASLFLQAPPQKRVSSVQVTFPIQAVTKFTSSTRFLKFTHRSEYIVGKFKERWGGVLEGDNDHEQPSILESQIQGRVSGRKLEEQHISRGLTPGFITSLLADPLRKTTIAFERLEESSPATILLLIQDEKGRSDSKGWQLLFKRLVGVNKNCNSDFQQLKNITIRMELLFFHKWDPGGLEIDGWDLGVHKRDERLQTSDNTIGIQEIKISDSLIGLLWEVKARQWIICKWVPKFSTTDSFFLFNWGSLVGVQRKDFKVSNFKQLYFNYGGDQVAQLLHVDRNLVWLYHAYKILQNVEPYKKCDEWNRNKHVYEFLRLGFASYVIAYYYTYVAARKWNNHHNHLRYTCADFIWVQNSDKYRRLLKTSWIEEIFGILKYLLRRVSPTESGAFVASNVVVFDSSNITMGEARNLPTTVNLACHIAKGPNLFLEILKTLFENHSCQMATLHQLRAWWFNIEKIGHIQWEPGENHDSQVACLAVLWCFKLWDPGERPLNLLFAQYLHLEDKVNFEGGSIDENLSVAELGQTNRFGNVFVWRGKRVISTN